MLAVSSSATRAVRSRFLVHGIDFQTVGVCADRNLLDLAGENARFIGSLEQFRHEILLHEEAAVRGRGFIRSERGASRKSLIRAPAGSRRSVHRHELLAKRRKPLFIHFARGGLGLWLFYAPVLRAHGKHLFRTIDAFIPGADFRFVFIDLFLLLFGKESVFRFRFIQHSHCFEPGILSLCLHFQYFLDIHVVPPQRFLNFVCIRASLARSLAFFAAACSASSLCLRCSAL